MSTLGWIVLLVVTNGLSLAGGFDVCWRAFVLRRGRRPQSMPNEPKLERSAFLPVLDRRAQTVDVQLVTIRHNADPNARN